MQWLQRYVVVVTVAYISGRSATCSGSSSTCSGSSGTCSGSSGTCLVIKRSARRVLAAGACHLRDHVGQGQGEVVVLVRVPAARDERRHHDYDGLGQVEVARYAWRTGCGEQVQGERGVIERLQAALVHARVHALLHVYAHAEAQAPQGAEPAGIGEVVPGGMRG